MPPVPQRQKIVNEYKLRLAAISTETPPLEDGFTYQTNLGAQPIDEWPTVYQESELGEGRLGICDLTMSKPQEHRDEKLVTAEMPMQVRIFHKQSATPAELRVMIGDVERALITDPETGKPDPQLGNLLVDMHSDEAGFIVPKDSFQIDGAAIGWKVYFLTAPFDAYVPT